MKNHWKFARRYRNPPAAREPVKPRDRIDQALYLIDTYGGIEGNCHKTWVLDQVVRFLCVTDKKYQEWVRKHQQGEDGPETYFWETGVAP